MKHPCSLLVCKSICSSLSCEIKLTALHRNPSYMCGLQSAEVANGSPTLSIYILFVCEKSFSFFQSLCSSSYSILNTMKNFVVTKFSAQIELKTPVWGCSSPEIKMFQTLKSYWKLKRIAATLSASEALLKSIVLFVCLRNNAVFKQQKEKASNRKKSR